MNYRHFLEKKSIYLLKILFSTQNILPFDKKRNGNPTISNLFQVAEGIGCDITDLFYSETEETAEELPENDNKAEPIQEVELENPIIQTETFCPHCGKRVKVGIV